MKRLLHSKRHPRILRHLCTILLLVPCAHANHILERVKTVDDPELLECIQVALGNIPTHPAYAQITPNTAEYQVLQAELEPERLATVRAVTESYTRIKLLDTQIQLLEEQLTQTNQPGSLRHELLLAQVELESKRTLEFAKLREVMRILPGSEGRITHSQLLSWIVLDVISKEDILIFTRIEDFTQNLPEYYETVFERKTNQEGAIDFIRSISNKEGYLPMRIEILRSYGESIETGGKLFKSLQEFAKDEGLSHKLDIHLNQSIRATSLETLYVLKGKLTRRLSHDRHGNPMGSNVIDINDSGFHTYISENFYMVPVRYPRVLKLRHLKDDKPLADKVAQHFHAYAEEHGLQGFISVELHEDDLRKTR